MKTLLRCKSKTGLGTTSLPSGCPCAGVGGYVFAGSLFALGLSSWQVLVSLIVWHLHLSM